MIQRRLFLVLLFFTTELLSIELQLTQQEKAFIEKHPTVTFASTTDSAPMLIEKHDGTFSGIDVEVAKIIYEKSGLQIVYENYPWEEAVQKAINKEVDGLASSVYIKEREKFFNFSRYYYKSTPKVYVKKGNPLNIKKLSELRGKSIAIRKGTKSIEKFAKAYGSTPLLTEDTLGIIHALVNGRVDYLLSFENVEYLAEREGIRNIDIAFALPKSSEVLFSIRKDMPELVSIINKVLNITPENELVKIRKIQWALVENKQSELYTQKSTISLTDEELQYLKDKKSITMCIDPNWMPFEKFDEEGRHIGMTSNYYNLFEKSLGVEFKVIQTDTWEQSLDFAKKRKCDILSLAMETPKRKEYLNFTTPYLKIPLVVATRPDAPFVNNINDIRDMKVGIPKGYAFTEILKIQYPEMKIVEVENIHDGLARVIKEELYGYIGTLATIGYLFQSEYSGELKIAGKLSDNWELGIGVRNDSLILLDVLQKAIENIDKEKQREILNQWVSIKYEKGVDYELIWKIALIFLGIIVLSMYWNRKLQKANRLLELQSEKFKSIFDLQNEITILTNGKEIVDANKLFLEFFRYKSIDEFKEKFNCICDHFEEAPEELDGKFLEPKDKVSWAEKALTKRDGRYLCLIDNHIFTISGSRLSEKSNEYIFIFDDVTDEYSYKKRLEKDIAVAKEKIEKQYLEILNSSKKAAMGELIGVIGHQLKQPLNSMYLHFQLIEEEYKYDELTQEKMDSASEAISKSVHFMSKSIDELRNFFRPNKESLPFSVEESIEKSLSIIENSISSKGIEINRQFGEDMQLLGIESELQQVIINLVTNAKDILVEKKPEKPFINITTFEEDEKAVITIEDNGGGIPEEIIDNIFDSCFTTKGDKGTGIGLNLVKMIIEDSMDGKVSTTNSKVGAVFKIELPITKEIRRKNV